MSKITTTLTILLLLLIVSCKPTIPGHYIQPDDMEDLLYDYHLSQGAVSFDDGNSMEYKRRMYFLAVLKKYGVSEAEFDSSMVYYYGHAELMADIYHRLDERMNAAAQKIGAEGTGSMGVSNSNGDTVNVWNGPRGKVLSARPLNNRLDFYIKADTSYRANDLLQLYFMSSFLYQEGTKDAVALMAVKYEGDTVVSRYQRVMSSGETRLTINERNGKKIKEIKGYIYVGKGNGDDSKTLKLLVVDRLQLMRCHQNVEPLELEPVKADRMKRDSLITDSLKAAPEPVVLPEGGQHKMRDEMRLDDSKIKPMTTIKQ